MGQILLILAAMVIGLVVLVLGAIVCPPISFPVMIIIYLLYENNRKTTIVAQELEKQNRKRK